MKDTQNSSSYKKMDRISTGDHFYHSFLSLFISLNDKTRSLWEIFSALCWVSQMALSHWRITHAGWWLPALVSMASCCRAQFFYFSTNCAPWTKDGERIHRWKSGVSVNKLDVRSEYKRKDKREKRSNGRKTGSGEWRQHLCTPLPVLTANDRAH